MKTKSLIEQKLKEARIENSSEAFKEQYKLKSLESVLNDFENKKNRFIFYCPDIIVVNSLVKLIYETAYEAYMEGYEVVILHEINGFKCKWLYQDKSYEHLKDIPVDYIIKQKSGKSKKTKSQYAFKPSDTLIVPDQFQEVLENLIDVKILQKVLFVTSYNGLGAMQPGIDYNALGVNKILFTEKALAADYSSLYKCEPILIDKYPINEMFTNSRDEKGVLPLISLSNIGNTDFVQQVVNIFYNKYPNLRVFNFRILDRTSVDLYLENLKRAAIVLILDKSLASNQMIYEAFAMGCPVGSFKRAELEKEVSENIYMGDTAFEIADNLAYFCQAWLNNRTQFFTNNVTGIKDLSSYTYENFSSQIVDAFELLIEDRKKFFEKVKESAQKVKPEEVVNA